MLNIGRMGPGSERYYLDAVARDGAVRDGVADYYLARGEVPGQWLGRAANGFGLDGEVTAEQLSRMLDGRDPTTGERLGTHPARKVPGFDLTFRAPKSVLCRYRHSTEYAEVPVMPRGGERAGRGRLWHGVWGC